MVVVAVVSALLCPFAPANAASGAGSDNVHHVATVKYKAQYGRRLPFGTDVEFARIAGREYAFAGTYRNGLQIVDVTNPREPSVAAVYDCAIAQGDVQVFRRGSRTFVAYAADDYPYETLPDSRCFHDVGVDTRAYGTFFIDVSQPTRPKTLGFARIPTGSHNQTVHPGGRYLYNSNANISAPGSIEILDISDPARAKTIARLPLGLGAESHDITFSADGKRAYAASLTHTVLIDTSKADRPKVVGTILDPSINIHHQAEPITIDDPLLGKRTFLVVTDELTGAAGNGFCPGGGLHVFDITGNLERTPVKVGYWTIPEVRPAADNLICTSHVLRLYPKRKLMTIGWYDAGVRIVDVSGLAGLSVGAAPGLGNVGAGMREIGYYTMPNAKTWSAKTNRFDGNGSFYLFGNDINRGLDVYHFDATAPRTGAAGVWMTPDEILAEAELRRLVTPKAFVPACVVPPGLTGAVAPYQA